MPSSSGAELYERESFSMGKINLKKSMIVTSALCFSILTLAGCGMNKQTLRVHFFLYDSDSFQSGCYQGSGGYSDIGDGMSVTLKNTKGEVIEIGSMKLNTLGSFSPNGTDIERLVDTCNYNYTFEGVPGNSDGYVVVVGSGKRGEMVYSKEELELGKSGDGDWRVDITLGN